MSPMVKDQNTKGILYIMTGMAFFSIQDSLIKFIYNDIALFELYLIKNNNTSKSTFSFSVNNKA